jgi:phage-related protein
MKALKFVGSSFGDLRSCPVDARRTAGFELRAIQNGFEPSDWKSMSVVGPGVTEIRIHVSGEWRVIYIVRRSDAIYVLHAFRKKSQKTNKNDIALARMRLKQIGGSV